MLCAYPAPIPIALAVELVRLDGTLVCPLELIPHATTVPLTFNASGWPPPAAIATMLVRLAGIVPKFVPQFVTEPLLSKARLWSPPAATAMTLVRPVGTLVWDSVGPVGQPLPLLRKAAPVRRSVQESQLART